MAWRLGRGEPVVRKTREEARAIMKSSYQARSGLIVSRSVISPSLCSWNLECQSLPGFVRQKFQLSLPVVTWILRRNELIETLSIVLICRCLAPPLEGTPALSSQLSGLAQNQARHHSTHRDAQVGILLGAKYCECSTVESLNFVCFL